MLDLYVILHAGVLSVRANLLDGATDCVLNARGRIRQRVKQRAGMVD